MGTGLASADNLSAKEDYLSTIVLYISRRYVSVVLSAL